MLELPEGRQFFEYLEYLSRIEEPLRLNDFHSHIRALGLPEFHPPIAFSSPLTFLAAPIRHRGEDVGAIYVGEKEQEFTLEDEETLVMFASQAALVIANAPPLPRGTAGQGRPRDADKYVPDGSCRLRREDGGRDVNQPGGRKNRKWSA